MGWNGIVFGALVGHAFGGPLGCVLGAAIGYQFEKRVKRRSIGGRRMRRPPADPLDRAYSVLGASAASSDEELKSRYRALAKRNHPDVLRAQGASEADVKKATERMGRINDAWKTIKDMRGIT